MRSNDERWELLGRVMVKWLSFGPNPSTETTAVSEGRQTLVDHEEPRNLGS